VVSSSVASGAAKRAARSSITPRPDGRELAPVAHQHDPGVVLIGNVKEGMGGVLVKHPGLVHQQNIAPAELRFRSWSEVGALPTALVSVDLPDVQGPGAVLVPPPAVLVRQPPRGERGGAELFRGDLGSLLRRSHHDQPLPDVLDHGAGSCQGGGLARAGRTLDDQQPAVTGQRRDDVLLRLIQPRHDRGGDRSGRRRGSGAGDKPSRQVGLHVQDVTRGESAQMLRQARPIQQRDTLREGSRGQIFGQFDPYGGRRDDPSTGQVLLDLAANVGGVPRRTPRTESRQHRLHPAIPVEFAGSDANREDRSGRLPEAERAQFGEPRRGDLGTILWDDLAGAGVVPRLVIPLLPQRPAGFLTRVGSLPRRLVTLQVSFDLRGPLAERIDYSRIWVSSPSASRV
jgi:hypothetical protein